MSPQLSILNFVLATGTLITQAALIFLWILLIAKKKNSVTAPVVAFLKIHGVLLAFLVALSASIGSLLYSEVAGFAPCSLCWYQRIFLYPEVFILGLALYRKEKDRIAPYALLLSAVGGLIALYHSYIQYGGSPLVPCQAAATAVSCAVRYVFEFGYITIPLMSLTVFAFIITVLSFGRLENTKK